MSNKRFVVVSTTSHPTVIAMRERARQRAARAALRDRKRRETLTMIARCLGIGFSDDDHAWFKRPIGSDQ